MGWWGLCTNTNDWRDPKTMLDRRIWSCKTCIHSLVLYNMHSFVRANSILLVKGMHCHQFPTLFTIKKCCGESQHVDEKQNSLEQVWRLQALQRLSGPHSTRVESTSCLIDPAEKSGGRRCRGPSLSRAAALRPSGLERLPS